MKTLLKIVSAIALAAGSASAQVVFSEIHYHPVEEPALLPDGTPALDLSDDVHEFVEIQNAGATTVDLSSWSVSGGIGFAFPTGTTLASGGFLVVAKKPAELAAVYRIPAARLLGPYTGKLNNHGDQLRLRDASGAVRDQVRYSSGFPWPNSADALGAQPRFTGLDLHPYQYQGRSLQRVSATWSGNDPANWLASPLASGPTPGAPQAVTRAIPQPVVVGLSAVQATDGAAVIRSNQPAKITATFCSTDSLSAVRVEYFQDDPESTSEPRPVVAMTAIGGGTYTATLPGFPDRTILRYRILANRGNGVEVVSPRADDAQVAPLGLGGAREAWHGYFVTPVRFDSAPYDLFVSTSALAALNADITQTPRRVTKDDATGLPREVPFVRATAPQWNGTQPAVFCAEGQVWDVQLRYHGGFTTRSAGRDSYKIHFPDFHPFHGVTSLFETDKDWRTFQGQAIAAAAGLPAASTHWVTLYINNHAGLGRLEQGEYNGELLDAFHRRQQRVSGALVREATAELYKSIGNIGNTANNSEGSYTRGDFAPIPDNPTWPSLQRYEWTYSLQNHGWRGHTALKSLVDSLWAARGDTSRTPNLNVAATRAWCDAHLDVDTTLTSLALLNWMGAWDDVCQNQFFWHRANDRWTRLPWDFDDLMSSSRLAQSIYVGGSGEEDPFFGPNWFKDPVLKCYRSEYRQRLWELNNTLLDPDNLAAMGLSEAAGFALLRRGQVNSQLGLGEYTKPNRPVALAPVNGAAESLGDSLSAPPFVHPAGTHAATKWEIRSASGDYLEPIFVVTSTTYKTTLPIPFDHLVYGQTYYWRATYLDQLGHPSVSSMEASFVWGGSPSASNDFALSEILAANHGAVSNGSSSPDYIEVQNVGRRSALLDGMSLTDDPRIPGKFTFPAGLSLAPGAYVVVWCDTDLAAPGLHAGFKLNASGQTVLLMNGVLIADSVTFGPQAPNLALGHAPSVVGWTLVEPSPGADNVAVPLGAPNALAINEWMAAPQSGDDWFELYNAAAQPVALGGLYLTDKLSQPTKTQIPPLSFIAAGGFTKFHADHSTGGSHCHFKLSAAGDSIALLAADGTTILNRVTFGPQAANVSQGRLPDGGPTILSFPHSASPGASNSLPPPEVVHEILGRASYAGTFLRPFEHGGYGRVEFHTSARGLVTGRLFADGRWYSFTGRFDALGALQTTIAVRVGHRVQFRPLRLQFAPDGSGLEGSFGSDLFTAERSAPGTTRAPVSGAGQYTALLRENGSTAGSFLLVIGANGSVRVSGTLGDGTAFTSASAISQTGRIPLSTGLSALHEGYLHGAAQLSAPGSARTLTGSLSWQPAPAATTTRSLEIEGAAFVPPTSGDRLLGSLSTARATLTGGALAPEPAPLNLSITRADQFLVPPSPEDLTLRVNPAVGYFRGTFMHTDGTRRSIRGVVLQRPLPALPTIEGSFPGGPQAPGTLRITQP